MTSRSDRLVRWVAAMWQLEHVMFLARATGGTSLYESLCVRRVRNKFLGFWLVTSVLYRKCTLELSWSGNNCTVSQYIQYMCTLSCPWGWPLDSFQICHSLSTARHELGEGLKKKKIEIFNFARRRTSSKVGVRLLLIEPLNCWQNSTPFWCKTSFCTIEIDDFRTLSKKLWWCWKHNTHWNKKRYFYWSKSIK